MDAAFAHQIVDEPDEEWDGYAMSNLRPSETGLPMVVWIQHGEGVRHDVRVKVSRVHGDKISSSNLTSVAVRPEPRDIFAQLDTRDFQLVARWIKLNETAIIDHWNGDTSSAELLRALQKL